MYYNLSDVVQKSLKLAWKHKILWVLVLLYSGGMGSGFNSFNNSSRSSTRKSQQENTRQQPIVTSNTIDYQNVYAPNNIQVPQPSNYGTEVASVPKTYGSQPTSPTPAFPSQELIESMATKILREVYPHIILLIGTFTLFMGYAIALALFLKGWTYGALINSVDDAIEDVSYTLSKLGSYGRTTTRIFIKYQLFGMGLMFTLVVLLLVAPAILLVIDKMFAIIYIFTLPLLFISILVYKIADMFAIRFIALDGLSVVNSLKSGLRLAKVNFGKLMLLAVTNCAVYFALMMVLLIGLGVVGLTLLIPVGIAAATKSEVLIGLAMMVVFPLVMLLVVAFVASTVYLKTYSFFTWNFFFKFAHNVQNFKIQDALPTTSPVNQVVKGETNG